LELKWTEPVWIDAIREWDPWFYHGYLPDDDFHDLYWIDVQAAGIYTAHLSYAPYTSFKPRYSIEAAKALCEKHADQHLEDYVLPLQRRFEQERLDAKRARS
jgi:hypothetical protein